MAGRADSAAADTSGLRLDGETMTGVEIFGVEAGDAHRFQSRWFNV
jgi:hypothetical protein